MKLPDGAREWRLNGQPAAAWLRDYRGQLVDRAMAALEPDGTQNLQNSVQLRWIVGYNISMFERLVDDPDFDLNESTGSDLVASATNRASEGHPIEDLLDSYVRGTRAVWSAISELVDDTTSSAEFLLFTDGLFEYLRAVVMLVARGFERESTRITAGQRDARFAVYSALVTGADAQHVANRAGIPLSTRYLVLAVHLGSSTPATVTGQSEQVPRLRRINEAQRVLADFADGDVLALIRDPTGVALVPILNQESFTHERLDSLAAALSDAVGVAVHLGAAVSAVPEIPTALGQAEEILELVTAIGSPPGAWTLEDVLIAYQLTRPGPARDSLSSRIAVLDEHPDWELTLRTYLSHAGDRQATAAALTVHPNTVDYRLRRFAQSTGLDSGNQALTSAIQSAIWIRDLERARDRIL